MILRLGTGWQTFTADLALILFLITAQASRDTPAAPERAEPSAATVAGANGAGLAIYRPGPGTDLGEWLETTLTDDRQGATVLIRYPAGGRDAAISGGSDLLEEIEDGGTTARLILEPGPRAESMVLVGYEGDPANDTVLAGTILAGGN
ncbi:MAG: hypothetical protein KJ703_07105 [Alphaproteobacteria bacterium]|nr:hypothetical protein [Alphaproteobacteria bacterium]